MEKSLLVGAWKLVSAEGRQPGGEVTYPLGVNPVGYLVYTEHGYVSTSIMRAERRLFASEGSLRGSLEDKAEAYDSFLGYAGRYEVQGDRVVHGIEVSSFPNWTGARQERFMHLEGDTLTLSTAPMDRGDGAQSFSMVWKRAGR